MTTNKTSQNLRQRLLAKFLRTYNRTNLRGQTLLTLLLARRMESLQAVPINIADWPTIYMDMRYVNAHSWLIGTPFQSSPHEVDEQAVMRRFVGCGDVAFDIGANLGLHTVMLAQLVGPQGRVVAFEPNCELLPMLERTIKGLSNTTLYSCALSDGNGESTLFVPDDHSMGSLADWTNEKESTWLRRLFGLGRTHTVTCRQRRMDELLCAEEIPQPDFIKCDVEGAELMVFKGGRVVLDRPDAPIIMFEAGVDTTRGFGLNITAAADFLSSLHYPRYQFLAVLEGGALHRVQPADFKHQNQNVLAVPQAKNTLCPELTGYQA